MAFLLALGLTLYPVISNYVNQKYASQIQTTYQEVMKQIDDSALREAKEQADIYNRSLIPGAAEAYSQEGLLAASADYDSQLNLAGNGIMGYVEIPKIRVNLPIYHGTENDSLERGIGHLLGSSLPVGGESTHSILSGHSGMASQKMFTDLEQLTAGDVFYLHVLDETLAYQVVEINTVLPYDTSLLGIAPGEDLCTLVTCTPYGVNTHRLLVRGSRIPYEEAEQIMEETASEEAAASTWEEKYLQGVMVDRKLLKNPNGLILGTPGSGKSFSAKREISNVFLATGDDIMICDPEGEYFPLVQRLEGQVIKISPTSRHHINPMDINLNYSDEENPLSLKSDFILSLCELIVGGKDGLKPVEKTIIDRCVRMVYQDYLNDPKPENMPILLPHGSPANCIHRRSGECRNRTLRFFHAPGVY